MKRLILQCKEPNTAISWTVRELVCESSRDSSRLREKSEQKGRGGGEGWQIHTNAESSLFLYGQVF